MVRTILGNGYDRNKFLILCYHILSMISEDPGDIAKQGLVCDICGELFDSVESLEQHREAEITNEEDWCWCIKI